MPPLRAPARADVLQLAARAVAVASASPSTARPSATGYVNYTHNDVHGSRIWTWDGRSSISLIFIVALLAGLVVLFFGLIALSHVLAHTSAPAQQAVLPFSRHRPALGTLPLAPGLAGPSAAKLSHPSSDPLAMPNPAMYARAPPGSASASPSPASSGQFFVEPLLAAAAPIGDGDDTPYHPRTRARTRPHPTPSSLRPSPADGPPPARLDPKRVSRYSRGPALDHHHHHHHPRSRSGGSARYSPEQPLDPSGNGHEQDHLYRTPSGGARRVQSIGRGNSLRYSRSREAEEDPQAQLGRSNSARLAAQAGRTRSGRRTSRAADRRSREVPYRDYATSSNGGSPAGSSYFHYQAPYRDDDSGSKSQRASTSNGGMSEELPLEDLPSRPFRRGWGYGTPDVPSPQ